MLKEEISLFLRKGKRLIFIEFSSTLHNKNSLKLPETLSEFFMQSDIKLVLFSLEFMLFSLKKGRPTSGYNGLYYSVHQNQ